jgi:hypothetical protein
LGFICRQKKKRKNSKESKTVPILVDFFTRFVMESQNSQNSFKKSSKSDSKFFAGLFSKLDSIIFPNFLFQNILEFHLNLEIWLACIFVFLTFVRNLDENFESRRNAHRDSAIASLAVKKNV